MKMIKEKSGKEHPEIALKISDDRALLDELWQTARQAASPMDIGPRSARLLRAWIVIGVKRMEMEGRLSPENLAIARNNLKHFIQLMKTEAVYLGHADRLDKDCFHAAHRRLERCCEGMKANTVNSIRERKTTARRFCPERSRTPLNMRYVKYATPGMRLIRKAIDRRLGQ
jgi:hypothetical protein